MILDRKKQVGNQVKTASKLHVSPTPSESSISVGEDNSYGNGSTKNQDCPAYSQAYVQPDKTLFDLLLEEDELNSMYLYNIGEIQYRKFYNINTTLILFDFRYGN